MKSIEGTPSLVAKKMQCKSCDGIFYEFDEQVEEVKWVGVKVTDIRL